MVEPGSAGISINRTSPELSSDKTGTVHRRQIQSLQKDVTQKLKNGPGTTLAIHAGGKAEVRDVVDRGIIAKVSADGEGNGKEKAGETSSRGAAAADKWKVPLLPQFRSIEERAEEFITKFRQDMKLQREQSILEFQEMLKRSA